jgi:hypothetical protein
MTKKLIIGATIAEVDRWASAKGISKQSYWAVAPTVHSYRGCQVDPEQVIWLRPQGFFHSDFLWAIEACILYP